MRSLRLLWQIFLGYLAVSLALLMAMGLYASFHARQFYLAQKAAELEAGARLCETQLADLVRQDAREPLQAACEKLGQSLQMRITVILPGGEVVGDSSENPVFMENHQGRPEVRDALGGKPGRATRFSATLAKELMYVAIPLRQDGAVGAAIRTSFAVQTMAQTLHAIYWRIAGAGLVAAVFVALASLVVAKRIVRPLEGMRAGAERFARGELKHRLPVSGAAEIRMLAQSLNVMAEELDKRIQTIVRQENEHQGVLRSMNEGVLAVDLHGTILNLNATCAALVGIDEEKARGRVVHEVIRRANLLEFIERTLADAAPVEADFELSGPESRWIHAHGTALHGAQDHRIGALIVLHDATRLRHLENIRRDFVANVSHELRTPITSIKGFVETLVHEQLEDREQSLQFLAIVLRQVNRLDAIIQDLLLLSRTERGAEEQTIELEIECLAEVIQAAAGMCERNAAKKSIRLEVLCPDDVVARVNAPLLEQAVMNLIDNAIKYSPDGAAVRISAEQREAELVIRVEDHGCGIAPKHLPRLFERFYRVDKNRSRDLGGTGLGLAIVKHIVTAHRGSVQVESTVGRGSVFSLHLPAAG
ncbi:MAG: HAMP domain-containing sensor histidine kinase [Thermoguttaceae bacterium]